MNIIAIKIIHFWHSAAPESGASIRIRMPKHSVPPFFSPRKKETNNNNNNLFACTFKLSISRMRYIFFKFKSIKIGEEEALCELREGVCVCVSQLTTAKLRAS